MIPVCRERDMADSLMVVEMSSTAATAMMVAQPSRDPGGPVHHEEERLEGGALVDTRSTPLCPSNCSATSL